MESQKKYFPHLDRGIDKIVEDINQKGYIDSERTIEVLSDQKTAYDL